MTIFDRIRRAFQPAPIFLPNVTAEQYAADRTGVTVLNSIARIVQIGPFKFRVIAADWPSIQAAETAASMLATILQHEGSSFGNKPVNDVLDDLGERIRGELGVDDSRPYGMCFTAEPV